MQQSVVTVANVQLLINNEQKEVFWRVA